MSRLAADYIGFQETCLSPFHVVATLERSFASLGFERLTLDEPWHLQKGRSYWVTHRDAKTLVAFSVRAHAPSQTGFAMIGSHTDSPVLRLRLNPWHVTSGYQRLLTEMHGGLILRSWMDRPLVLAGMVYTMCRDSKGQPLFDKATGLPKVEKTLVQTSNPVAVIPDIAIHLDRDKNGASSVNAETMMAALLGCGGGDVTRLKGAVAKALEVGVDKVDGFELNLAPYFPHTFVGLEEEFICGPRHDDLAMVFASAKAMAAVSGESATVKTPVVAFFDAEETGSQTASGAGSSFMRDILERIEASYPYGKKDVRSDGACAEALHKSFLVSGDMAHGFHPSYPEKHDELHRPVLNGGLVLKQNANDRYATSGESGTLFRALCEACGVKLQPFIARQDMGCGSTIGPILSSRLGCPGVDVGLPMWAMHSATETMGAKDLNDAFKVFCAFLRGMS